MEYLNLEAKCPHTLFVCLDQVCAHSLSLFNDAIGNRKVLKNILTCDEQSVSVSYQVLTKHP